jgi:hypothetical protein
MAFETMINPTSVKRAEIVFLLEHFSRARCVKEAERAGGFMSDGGYSGVLYPASLDEYDKQVLGLNIPEGFVELHYWDGDFRSIQLPEGEYLAELRKHLDAFGDSDLVRTLDATAIARGVTYQELT